MSCKQKLLLVIKISELYLVCLKYMILFEFLASTINTTELPFNFFIVAISKLLLIGSFTNLCLPPVLPFGYGR